MATFNILGFNQKMLMQLQEEKGIKLNGNDLIVLRSLVDKIESSRFDTKEIDREVYTWIKYSLFVEDLIFVSDKEDTFKKIVTKLIKIGLIERKVIKSVGHGAYTYFRKTFILESIIYHPEVIEEQKEVENKPIEEQKDIDKVLLDQGEETQVDTRLEEIKALIGDNGFTKSISETNKSIEFIRDLAKQGLQPVKIWMQCNKTNMVG